MALSGIPIRTIRTAMSICLPNYISRNSNNLSEDAENRKSINTLSGVKFRARPIAPRRESNSRGGQARTFIFLVRLVINFEQPIGSNGEQDSPAPGERLSKRLRVALPASGELIGRPKAWHIGLGS